MGKCLGPRVVRHPTHTVPNQAIFAWTGIASVVLHHSPTHNRVCFMNRVSRIPGWIWFSLAVTCITAWLYRSFIFDAQAMLFGREMITQAYQLRQFGVTEIQSGRGFPLWNPYVFGGLPYLAILPGPVFYPTTFLYLLMPLYRAIGWTFVLHTMLAGGAAYAAARSLRLDRW